MKITNLEIATGCVFNMLKNSVRSADISIKRAAIDSVKLIGLEYSDDFNPYKLETEYHSEFKKHYIEVFNNQKYF